MKLKLLLIAWLFCGGILSAQDTIKTLIISEIRLSHHEEDFVEITNIGDEAVQLSQFEFGLIRCWNNVPWIPENDSMVGWGRPLKGGSREKTPLPAKNTSFSLEP